jgi:hypothetical protein
MLDRLCLTAALLASPAAAVQEGWAEQRDAALHELVVGLEEYAAWCQKERLFLERSKAHGEILAIDTEHVEARQGLGYKRKKGEWVPPKRPKAPANYDDEALLLAPDRLDDTLRPFAERMVALVGGGDLTPVEAEEALALAVRYVPNHRAARALRGEVEWNGRWVLQETAAASRRRARLTAIVRESLREAPAGQPVEPDAREAAFGLALRGVATPDVRVFTTGALDEAAEVARDLHAARALFSAVLESQVAMPDCTVFLMAQPGEGVRFLDQHPDIDDEYRTVLKRLDGAGLVGTTDWAFWTGKRPKRVDGIVRMAFGYFLLASCGITLETGWLAEGLGLYLTNSMIGTRLNWFSQPSPDVDPRAEFAKRERLQSPSTNWMEEARSVLAGKRPPDLARLLAKPAAELTSDELLVSYALTAYLVEARPDDTPTFLRSLGSGSSPDEVFAGLLGLDLSVLPARLARWIDESHAEELEAPLEAAKLQALWDALDADGRARTIELFEAELRGLETLQIRLVRGLVERGTAYGPPPEVTPLPQYDENEHAPGLPIERYRLEEDHPLYREVLHDFFPPPHPRALRAAYRYDWGKRLVERTGDPEDLETVFANGALGYPPGLDLALAQALKELDDGEDPVLMAAFHHVYTDRDGGVYPGVTLYDAWASGVVIEMPDVDALGIIHDVLDDWTTWVSPIPGSMHAHLYAVIQRMYERARRYRMTREALAEHLLIGEPASASHLSLRTNLHALWDREDSKPAALARKLPEEHRLLGWLEEWVEECKREGALFSAGRFRRQRLNKDGEAVRLALTKALRQAAAPPAGGD